jgi:DNA-binding transcriptional LysR family regulator
MEEVLTMDLLQLKYFQTVARLEHMTRAAEALSIAQPSLSKMIARLEEELEVPLFDRQGRHIRLNQYGKAFLAQVEKAFQALDEGKRQLEDMVGLERGHIALSTVSAPLLTDLLSAFYPQYPHISFRLFQQSTTTMLDQLERGELDFCLAPPPIKQAGLNWISLVTEEIFLIVPQQHHLAGHESIALSEAANESFISLKPGYGLRDLTDQYCQQAGFTPHILFEGDEPAAIRALVRAGLGIAFTTEFSWKSMINDAELAIRRLHIREPRCQRTIGLAWSQERYLSLAARQFRQFVVDYFAQQQPDASRVLDQ